MWLLLVFVATTSIAYHNEFLLHKCIDWPEKAAFLKFLNWLGYDNYDLNTNNNENIPVLGTIVLDGW